MGNFQVRVGKEFDVYDCDDSSEVAASHVTVNVTVNPNDGAGKASEKPSITKVIVYVAIGLFVTSVLFALAYGVVSGDVKYLHEVADKFLELATRLSEAIAKK